MSDRTRLRMAQRNQSSSRVGYAHRALISLKLTSNQTNPMIINLLLPKWLARKFARPRARTALRPELKRRQILPTLPEQKRYFVLSR
jgi:hypothetical protein